jgi:hypothetical protein
MKRVKAACILQTLVFAQKDDCGLTREQQFKVNHDEVSHYKATMDRSRTGIRSPRKRSRPTALCWFASASSTTTKLM